MNANAELKTWTTVEQGVNGEWYWHGWAEVGSRFSKAGPCMGYATKEDADTALRMWLRAVSGE